MILAVLQARFSSSRLPGKIMLPLLGEPMLIRQIERIRRSRRIDRLIVATSTDSSDDPLAELCRARQIDFFRGSLEDVLDRFYRAALAVNPDQVVRLTGDCPLTDPAVIDAVIDFCVAGGFDYASNALAPTFPDGLDVEVMKFSCLREAWKLANLPSQREHVTPYIYQQSEKFKIGSYRREPDISFLRWTVDEMRDFQLVGRVYEALYPLNQAFSTDDILAYLARHPELQGFNATIERNEGFKKSLQLDKAFLDKDPR